MVHKKRICSIRTCTENIRFAYAARNNHAFSLRGVRRYSRAVILRGGRAAEAIDLAVASVAAAAALYCSACLQQVLNQWIYLANLLV